MNIRKSIRMAAISLAASVTLLAGALPAMAANDQAKQPNLIDRIAQAFGLKHDDVAKVVQEHRAERQQDRRAKLEDRLTQAVKDGKITELQKTAILQKADELKSFADSLKDKTPQERRDAMRAKHDELVQWAKDNNIPAPFDRIFLMGNGSKHHHMHR